MKKKNKYLDIFLFGLLIILAVFIFYWDISDTVAFSINDLLLIGLLIFSYRSIFYNSAKGQYLLLILIILSLPGLLTTNFNLDGSGTSVTFFHMGALKFNPLSFLLLVLYILINRKNFLSGVGKILYGSEQEKLNKRERDVLFYYTKFNDCTPDELDNTFKLFDQYPPEAKEALKRIHIERGLSLLSF